MLNLIAQSDGVRHNADKHCLVQDHGPTALENITKQGEHNAGNSEFGLFPSHGKDKKCFHNTMNIIVEIFLWLFLSLQTKAYLGSGHQWIKGRRFHYLRAVVPVLSPAYVGWRMLFSQVSVCPGERVTP